MVNIIIPYYNDKEGIQDALESLKNQTKKMFVITIVDDNSSEDIQEIVDEFNKTLNIRYLRQEKNLGPGMARQRGINACNNFIDYIMFLDSDDILYPRAVEILYREAKRNNADVVSSDIMVEQKYNPGRVLKAQNSTTWTHGKIYRLDFLKEKNISFFENIRCNEDAAFNLIVHEVAKRKFSVSETTYLWRDNKNSLTRQDRFGFIKKYNHFYIEGQCKAILQIISLKENINNLIYTIENIYNQYQVELYNKANTEVEDYLIYKVLNHPKIISLFKEIKVQKALGKTLRGATIFDNILIMHKQTFLDWIGRYNKEIKNILWK